MHSYIALFKGINMAGKRILPMKYLANLFEEMGCDHVRTYIQSGNVVFRRKRKPTGKFVKDIGARIQQSYGFEPKMILLDAGELWQAIEANPFNATDGKTLHLFFLGSLPDKPDLAGLMKVKAKSEAFKLINKVFYLYTPDGVGRSKLAAKVEKGLGVAVTARNWNTVTKLAAMAGE